jgi:hypothetical protein
MISRLKAFIRPFCTGLFTGAAAHGAASILVLSFNEVCHFVGHVVAAVVLRLMR